jgi:hypothetical protein
LHGKATLQWALGQLPKTPQAVQVDQELKEQLTGNMLDLAGPGLCSAFPQCQQHFLSGICTESHAAPCDQQPFSIALLG